MSFLGRRGQRKQPTAKTKVLLVVSDTWKINFSFSKTEFKGLGFGFLERLYYYYVLGSDRGARDINLVWKSCGLLVLRWCQAAGGRQGCWRWAETSGQWATACINLRGQHCWSPLPWQQPSMPGDPKNELNGRKLLVPSEEKRNESRLLRNLWTSLWPPHSCWVCQQWTLLGVGAGGTCPAHRMSFWEGGLTAQIPHADFPWLAPEQGPSSAVAACTQHQQWWPLLPSSSSHICWVCPDGTRWPGNSHRALFWNRLYRK